MEVMRENAGDVVFDALESLDGFDEELWAFGGSEDIKPEMSPQFVMFPGREEDTLSTEIVTEDARSGEKVQAGGMYEEEHSTLHDDIDEVRHRRKLRNRESAARSRKKQQTAIEFLRKEVREMCECSKGLLDRCQACAMENARLKEENTRLFCQNTKLRLELFMIMCAKSAPQLEKISAVTLGADLIQKSYE